MTDKERQLWNGIVHQLRNKGWSRIDAESEADDRIELLRAMIADQAKEPTP